jgi:hypothetical protein
MLSENVTFLCGYNHKVSEYKVKKGKEHRTTSVDRKGVVPNMSKHPFSLIVSLFWRSSTLVSPIH